MHLASFHSLDGSFDDDILRDLAPAPRAWLASLYALIMVPILGTALLWPTMRWLRKRLERGGRHLGALEVQSHARGALVLGLVWSLAFVCRAWLLEGLLWLV